MKYVGKYGEYRVLARFLEMDIEAYPAIKTNQDDYDITAVLSQCNVIRIQVKTTELNNKSTNNPIPRVDKKYDFLIVVVINNGDTTFYVMTKSEAMQIKGNSKQLGITCRVRRKFQVKECIKEHVDKWDKIRAYKKPEAEAPHPLSPPFELGDRCR